MKTLLVAAKQKLKVRGDRPRLRTLHLNHLPTFLVQLGQASRPLLVMVLAATMALLPPAGSLLGHASKVHAQSSAPARTTPARVSEVYGQLPLSFEINKGQAGSQIQFLARGQGYNIS